MNYRKLVHLAVGLFFTYLGVSYLVGYLEWRREDLQRKDKASRNPFREVLHATGV